MGRPIVHYADNKTNNAFQKLLTNPGFEYFFLAVITNNSLTFAFY